MSVWIVPEGEQIRYTSEGIVLVGEFSRAVTISCGDCGGSDLPLRLCSDEMITTEACDKAMDDYLASLGWTPDAEDWDVCPQCTGKRRA